MKYVQTFTDQKGRKAWRFDPPREAFLAGVCPHYTWTDEKVMQFEAPLMFERVEKFLQGELAGNHVGVTSSMPVVVGWWIRKAEPPQYKINNIRSALPYFKHKRLMDMDGVYIKKVYKKMLDTLSVSQANQNLAALSSALDFCVEQGLIGGNPSKSIKREVVKRFHTVRENKWTDEFANKFADYCFGHPERANMGVIAVLTASTLQPCTDVSTLTWNDVDLEQGRVCINDKVFELSENVHDLLRQQHKRYGHQRYVAPDPIHGVSSPYGQLNIYFKRMVDAAGLPDGLTMVGLRDFYVQKKADDGVTPEQLRFITGYDKRRIAKFYPDEGLKSLFEGDIIRFPTKE